MCYNALQCHTTLNILFSVVHSLTLGAHTHAHGFWVGMGAIFKLVSGHGWAWLRKYCFMGEHGLKQNILEGVIE